MLSTRACSPRGEINPTFRTLRTLADGLEVELSSLIRLHEERHEDRGELASRVIRAQAGSVRALQRDERRMGDQAPDHPRSGADIGLHWARRRSRKRRKPRRTGAFWRWAILGSNSPLLLCEAASSYPTGVCTP